MGGLRSRRKCVDEVFTQEKYGGTTREKKWSVYVGFVDVKKTYGMVNQEDLWKVNY